MVIAKVHVGIFGGTFDPPHCGHEYVASRLKKFLQLDEVWWVVTAANHLKSSSKYSYDERVSLVRKLTVKHKGMRLLELPSSRAYDVVRHCKRVYPYYKFIWIGGSDNIAHMHRWYRWRDFCAHVPIVLLARPGYVYPLLRAPFAVSIPRVRLHCCGYFLTTTRGAWDLVRARMCCASSTEIRSAENCKSEEASGLMP